MADGFNVNHNPIGVIGSIIGIFAGISSAVNVFNTANLTVVAYMTEIAFWFLWLFIQGIGFLNLYRESDANVAIATFIFAVISALIEVAVLLMIFNLPDGTDLAAIFASYLQLFFAILLGTFSEGAYFIVGGIAILHVTRRGSREGIGLASGIVFILSGCLILLGLFGTLSIFIPIFVIAANILACTIFLAPISTNDNSRRITYSETSIELE